MLFTEFAKRYKVRIETATPLRSRPDTDFNRADQSHFSLLLTMANPRGPDHRGDFKRVGLWRGDYSLGFGHAESWAKNNKTQFWQDHRVMDYLKKPLPWGKSHLPDSYYCQTIKAKYEKRVGIANNWELNKARAKPFKPVIMVDEILCSLQMDISGSDQRFEDWVNDLGYEADSRKAYSIWETVNDERRDLEAVFSSEQLTEFMECEE